jgi:hypothetical protein
MQYNKNKFLGILVMALAFTILVATAQAAMWDSTMVYYATSVTKYDVAVGDKLKGASDDTVRIVTTQSSSPYSVLISTDRSTAPPMSWVTETVTNTVAMRGCAIGDVDGDGQNEIIVGHTSSPYGLKMIKWSGSAWVMTTVFTSTSSYVSSCYDIAIGDADNNAGTPNDIIFNNGSYGVMKARWNGASFDTTRILYKSGSSYYGVAIGDFDQTYAGNEIVTVNYNQYIYRIHWNGASWDTATIFYSSTDYDFYDVAVGDFDASNPGDEIAINNGYSSANAGVYELYGSGSSWTFVGLYVPGSGWSSSGEIAVGDFYSGNSGAEIVATSGSGSSYEARLVYGSGSTWYNEQIMSTGGSSDYGVAVGDLNRYHTGNELAVGGNYKVWEAEEFIPLPNDVGVSQVFEPSGKGHVYKTGTPDSIGMEVTNYGTLSQSNFYVHYDLVFDEGRDSVLHTATLAAGAKDTIYAYWTPERIGIDTIYGWTALSGDEWPTNDGSKLTVSIYTAGLVLFENFDGATFPPAGWTVYNFDGGDAWSQYTGYYHSAPACARIYYDIPNNDWLITPSVSVQSGHRLNFWWRTQSTSYTETLFVRVSTGSDVSDTGSYSIIDMVSSTGNTSWFNKEIDLSSYAGQDIYIAFWYRVNNFYGMALDDITVYSPGPRIAISPSDSLLIPMVPDQILDTTLFISNVGGDTLTYSIAENPAAAWLTETPSSGDLLGGSTDTINLHLDATGYGLGTYRTVLQITSNSETKGGIKAHDYLPVIMKLGGPHVSVAPESLHVGVCPPATKDTSLILTSDGDEDLVISGIKVKQTYPKGPKFYMGTLPKDELIPDKDDKPDISKSKRRMSFKSGGPDIYGHYWIDSDDPGGPAFNWIEISGTGNSITGLTDDNNVGPYPIGFDFDFYGNTFNTIRVCSNGWFSFTSTATSLTNYALPSASAPENLLAIFWDDMNFNSGGAAYYQTIGDQFILEFKDVPRYSTLELYTYEVILDKICGKITYQYLSMQPGRLNEATIGIQNDTKTDGLTIAHDEYYVHDSLAILIQPYPLWVSVDPCQLIDTLQVDSTVTLGVTFNSGPYTSGNFQGEIELTTNAPGQFTKAIPVAMDILGPAITVTPSSITDTCQEGGTAQNFVTVQNNGNCPLNFTVGAGCAWVSVVPNSGSLNPTESMQLTVTEDCTNLWSGDYVCEVRISSNDPAQPLKIVNIYKHVGPDADIAVTPDSFSVELYANTSKDTSMNIANTGNGHLLYSIATEDFVPPKVVDTLLTQGFEGTWLPAGWTRVQTNTGYQGSYPCYWSQMTYPSVHSGTYAAGFWWSYDHQDEWLISPPVNIAGACTLSFWTYGCPGSIYGDHYYVKVSTDGGSNWNPVFDLSALPPEADTFNHWEFPYKVGLNAYAGQTVNIAWHAIDADPSSPNYPGMWYIWLIDDVTLISSGANWLVVDPTSGVVNPHDNKNINVTFNSSDVTESDKYAHIFIASNDPDEGMVAVRAHMKIIGPNYSVTPAETLVINALEGQYTDAFLTFGNMGGRGPLICKVSDALGKGDWLAELPDSFQIPIDQTFDDTIRVDGNQLISGDYSTKIYIQTNDINVPHDTIVVIVHVGPEPGISINPNSFTVTVSAGTSKDTIMNITNTGGGHLAFEMSTEEQHKGKSDTTLIESFEGTFPPTGPLGTWTVVNNDGGTVQWEQSSSYAHTGTYSASCRWESTTLWNDDWLITPQMPMGGTDTLSFWYRIYSTTWPESLEVRLSTMTNNVADFTHLLWAGGNLLNTTFVEEKIGLSDYSGEQVYIAFVYKGLDEFRIYLDDVKVESFAPEWLSVAPMADTVAPSASVACTVTFDATGLLGGEKDGNIIISSNAPGKRVDTVGVHMSVAGANYSVHPLELDVNVDEGQIATEHLNIMNSGLGPLFYKMTWAAAWLTANPDTEMVPPSGSQDVLVRIDATLLIAGEYYTEILVKTNAANQLLDTIPVFVHVGPNPDIDVSPMSLRVPVIPGCDKPVSVKVSNLGLGHLSFEAYAGKESGPKLSAGFNPNQLDVAQMMRAEELLKTKEARPVNEISPSHLWSGEVTESRSVNPPAAGAGIISIDRGDSLYYQRPYDPSESWAFYTTSSSAGYTVYDNFWLDPNARICDIHWWGLTAWNDGVSWYSCDPAGMQVEIKFYSDDPNDTLWGNMPPTDAVCTYSNVVPTYVFYNTFSGFSAYYFSVDLAPCCDLTAGWVSIQSTYTPTTCWLLWSGSPQPGMGDGFGWQQGSSSSSIGEDLAIYLTGETAPPCPFSVSPVADTLDPSSFEDVILTFDGAAFDTCSEETLTCNLVFTTNDPVDPTVTVPVSAWAARGDVFYPECAIQLGDVVYLINYVYKHGPGFSPLCRGDCAPSHDGMIDNEDIVYLMQFLYQEGPPPFATPAIDQPEIMERK